MSQVPVLVQVNHLGLGGTQINAVDTAAAMQRRGFDSLLVGPLDSIPDDGPSLLDVARERGVRLEPIDRPSTTLSGARELSRLAHRHRAQLVHTYGTWSIRSAFWGPCLLARRPLVMTVYEMQVHPSVYRAAGLVVGTKYLEEEQADRRGPVRLISPPVDLDRDDPDAIDPAAFLAEHDLDPDHTRIVVVSRLDDASTRPVKSTAVEVAMRALPELGDDVDLVVVGSGNDEARLRAIGAQIDERLGRRAVVFTGAMSDPRPAYRAADVVLGMGGSAARALAFGRTLVVAGEFGWFGTFEPDTSAALFRKSFWSEDRPNDAVGHFVDVVAPLLADPSRREQLGHFGRTFAVDNFGMEAMADRLAEVYDTALRTYRARDWAADLAVEGAWARSWVGRKLGMGTPRPSELHREEPATGLVGTDGAPTTSHRRVGLLYPTPDPSSTANWSGTPSGLTGGLTACGATVVPIGDRLPAAVRKPVGALSRLGGRRGAVASRSALRSRVRTWSLAREVGRLGPLDALVAMGTEMYDLGAVRPPGLPVATYDDCTLEQMWRNPDAEIRSQDFPDAEVRTWFARQAASTRAATACCVSTEFAARSFVQDYGIDPAHVHVVGMGHRPRTHTAAEDKDWSTPRFLFVGVEWPRKNGEAVLAAFREVRASVPDATLDVVGRHPQLDEPGVTGHGFLPREDPAAQELLDGLFARATAFVLPSRFDPSPIAYLEAASAGLPVIATTEGGAGELLGPAAITVDPFDHAALVAAMLHLTDPDEARRMGREAAERAKGSSWADVAARILATLG